MGHDLEVFWDVSREKVRPYVPEKLRLEVFYSLHNLSHPEYQRSKFQRHTVSFIQPFASTLERFQHVHVDLVGSLPPSDGFTYLLTCIDRYTRRPESIPLSELPLKKLHH
ncbi:transposon Tf2-6 polyprotein [Nephila pilipes]|uniref:Transposon Tf2-6 polyprotein n=1 Tax=Nephila pilipes TaxID=299642 RepID=A0A8X6PH24_NEPPI|nr:transposon Tf2-6 polyprotein [Nephila pilipes]